MEHTLSIPDLPIEIYPHILHNLDIWNFVQSRTVCKEFKRIVNHTLSLRKSCNFDCESDGGTRISMVPDSFHYCVYSKTDTGCEALYSIENEKRKRKFEGKDPSEIGVEHFGIVARNPVVRLDECFLCLDAEREEIFFNNVFGRMMHKLHTKYLEFYGTPLRMIRRVLGHVQPGFLQQLWICDSPMGEEAKEVAKEIAKMDQWKLAKELMVDGWDDLSSFPIDDVLHTRKFIIDLEEITVEDLVRVKEHDMLTQDIKFTTADRYVRQPNTRNNIANKINIKLGGLNYDVESKYFDKNRLVIGFETSQKGGGGDAPIAIGFSANMSDHHMKFTGGYYLVKRSSDVYGPIIKDVVKRCLNQTMKNRTAPTSVVVYFSGVTEGQYGLINEKYVGEIKEACRSIKGNYRPHITVIAAINLHNTRLYKQDQRGVPKIFSCSLCPIFRYFRREGRATNQLEQDTGCKRRGSFSSTAVDNKLREDLERMKKIVVDSDHPPECPRRREDKNSNSLNSINTIPIPVAPVSIRKWVISKNCEKCEEEREEKSKVVEEMNELKEENAYNMQERSEYLEREIGDSGEESTDWIVEATVTVIEVRRGNNNDDLSIGSAPPSPPINQSGRSYTPEETRKICDWAVRNMTNADGEATNFTNEYDWVKAKAKIGGTRNPGGLRTRLVYLNFSFNSTFSLSRWPRLCKEMTLIKWQRSCH
ncbi:hypothetical protein CAEBREN_12808 [Caenorhabditis brenneri]|uniref:F-box domain-containing protein n=1 Tax=Caenorhabditis brenneri TaxID=135651 RepID=G0NTP1_CAEBE|nr:hypothetical protein CAEBREN_12808 [Caenorhabditis brenneri]